MLLAFHSAPMKSNYLFHFVPKKGSDTAVSDLAKLPTPAKPNKQDLNKNLTENSISIFLNKYVKACNYNSKIHFETTLMGTGWLCCLRRKSGRPTAHPCNDPHTSSLGDWCCLKWPIPQLGVEQMDPDNAAQLGVNHGH